MVLDIAAEDLLRSYDSASLQQLARQRGVKVAGTSKEKLITALAPGLYNEMLITTGYDGLSDVERLVLNRVIMAGGMARTDAIRQQLQAEGHVDPEDRSSPRYYGYQRNATGTLHNRQSTRFEDIVVRLGILALLFTTEPRDSYRSNVSFSNPGHRLFIPDAVLRLLPPVEFPVTTAPEPATTNLVDAALLQRDLYHLVTFADREKIPLTVKGLIVKRALARIAPTLQRQEDVASVRAEDDLAWLPFLRALAEELDLLVATSGELVQGSRVADFLRLPDGVRRRTLFDAYRVTTFWSEIYRIPNLRIRGREGSLHDAHPLVIEARLRILAELTELPAETWIPLSHLTDRLRQRAYELLLPRQTQGSYYYYGYSSNPYSDYNQLGVTFDVADEASGWNIVEGGMIRVVVTEALHALGVVDLGEDDDAATVFRITSDGALLLRGETPPSDAATAEVIVQPNFQVFAFPPTGEDTLFTLDQVADRVKAGQVMEYELTRASIYRAQQAGLDTAAIVSFLEGVSKVGLPQNVQRTIEEWGEQIERITVRPRVTVLQTVDAATLDTLIDDPAIAPLLGRRLAPTAALVSSAQARALADALVARDILPALTEGEDREVGARISVDRDGRVTFNDQLPSIYVLQALRPFVEERVGGLHITVGSLRAAAKAGIDADAIVATIQRLSEDADPEVEALVRRWAKDWGHGALVAATILQVDRPETLADLLADPETRPLLQLLPNAPTYAIVADDAVDALRELLNARGMALSDRVIRS